MHRNVSAWAQGLLYGIALAALASGIMLCGQEIATPSAHALPWDEAFRETDAAAPLHFEAEYVDAHDQTHHLQEWRIGQQHLRRRTDNRIDLFANATTAHAPYDYAWQILDLRQHIAHRVSTAGMLHLGMLYSFYSMAHVLTRPAGGFSVTPSTAPEAAAHQAMQPLPHPPCSWYELQAAGQPGTRVCWMPHHGVPAQLWSATPAGWRLTFQLTKVSSDTIPAEMFTADTTGFQVRNLDEIQAED